MRTLTEVEVREVSGGMGKTTKVMIGGALAASPAFGVMLLLGYYSNNQC